MTDVCGACEGRSFYNPEPFVAHMTNVHPDLIEDEAAKTPSGANAPYKIFKVGKKFVVKNNTGETKATFADRDKALAYLRALYASVKGAAKRADKVKFSGKAKQRISKASLDEARKFSAKQRDKMAGGAAMPDGSFPIQNKEDLKNAIQAFGRAKNKAAAKAHIMKRARALGATDMLPEDWKKEKAEMHHCLEPHCGRSFLDAAQLQDHADSVHTYSEIESKVSMAVRSKFGRPGSPMSPAIYAWVNDLSDDWVVFTLDENGGDNGLFKSSYSISDTGQVTLGDPVAVERRVVYVPTPQES